jgi:protoheme IX farnesyltransferase
MSAYGERMVARAAPPPSSRRRAATGLLLASHPEPTVAVTAFAVGLGVSSGRSASGLVAVGTAVLAGHLSVGWHNDWLDVERDRAAGRTDKPAVSGQISRRALGRAMVIASVAVVPLSFLSGWRAALAHLLGVALAWAYNGRLKSTVVSIVPYGVAFPLLVAFVSLGRSGHPWPPWWALVTAGLLGCGAHLVNAAPDLTDDLAAGVRGLPQRLGRGRSVAGAVVLLLAATVVVSVGPGHPGWGAVAAIAGAVAVVALGIGLGRRPGSRWLFRAALGVALIDVVVLIARGHAA